MHHKEATKVLIIGESIIGMSTAYQMLKDAYQDINIVSKNKPLEASSNVAAALF